MTNKNTLPERMRRLPKLECVVLFAEDSTGPRWDSLSIDFGTELCFLVDQLDLGLSMYR